MNNKRLNVDIVDNQSNAAISIDEAKVLYPASEHEYYSERDIEQLIHSSEMAKQEKYPTKELNAFVQQEVERVLTNVAIIEVKNEHDQVTKVYASKKTEA